MKKGRSQKEKRNPGVRIKKPEEKKEWPSALSHSEFCVLLFF